MKKIIQELPCQARLIRSGFGRKGPNYKQHNITMRKCRVGASSIKLIPDIGMFIPYLSPKRFVANRTCHSKFQQQGLMSLRTLEWTTLPKSTRVAWK